MASQIAQSNSTAPIPMQPPIPSTTNPSTQSIAPLPNPNNPTSNINNTQTQHTQNTTVTTQTIPSTTNLSLIPKQTTIPNTTTTTNPISTISPSLKAESTTNNMNLLPNPNDKDSRRLKGRNHRTISTPSHKLLTLHHKPITELTSTDMRKYLQDVPCELLSDCLIELCINNTEIFTDFDNYALIDPTKIRIFIRGLNYDTDKETLAKAFQRFGTVIDATVIYDKTNNRSKGYGFITFSTSVEAAAACRHGQLEVDSRRTQISLATPLRSKSFGDRDRRNNQDTDRDYRHRNRRSRSRSRSRDRDNRRHKRENNKRRDSHRGNHRFNSHSHRGDRRGGHGGDRRNNNRGRFGANHSHRHKTSRNMGRGGHSGGSSGGGYQGMGVGRGGYMGHDTRHGVTGVAPPVPMVGGVYGGFNYGYDTSAYAAAGVYNPAGGYGVSGYGVGGNTNAGVNVNTSAGVNASGMVQPQYNGNLYAQQYAGYNPYFAGK